MANLLNKSLFLAFLLGISVLTFGQNDTTAIKKGWSFVPFPVLGYDADMGFQFGALGNAFYYGDGSQYPEYLHSIYAEASWYTKGSAVYQLFYDSKYLLPWGIRITADFTYLTEKSLDFYGFNGYQAAYDPVFEDDASDEYISRVFYRQDRKLFRTVIDLQGNLAGPKLRWLAGFSYFNIQTASVDIDNINKGKKESKQLPDTTLLYDNYVDWGLIAEDEKDGGNTLMLKLGLVFDTRDNEPAPNSGVWTEVLFLAAPGFIGNDPYAFNKLAITHRQYISLLKNRLVLAYRLSMQSSLGKSAPYYILPYQFGSFSKTTKPDGLGGATTIRGVLRDRVVGDGTAYGNIELRWKFLRTILFNQNLYLALHAFYDAGQVIRERELDMSMVPPDDRESAQFFDQSHDSLHQGLGLGLRVGLNENFVLVVDYGMALDSRDGQSGLYVGIGNIF
ncbi:MAG: BamA/TamA family outer membrane protein [Bacteroidota bacterium]